MSKTLKELQHDIDVLLQGYEKPYWEPLSILAQLVEETGEVARIINHVHGDKPRKPSDQNDDLEDEIADVLWSLICLANVEGVDLEKGLQRSIHKLVVRDKNRFKKRV